MSQPAQLVVDASVAVKWYVPEVGSDTAVRILESGQTLLAPDLLVAEFGNILWKKVSRGLLEAAEAKDIASAFLSTMPLQIRSSELLLRAAVKIATTYGCTVYDAVYLSLAVAEDCPMVTADDRLVQMIKSTSLEPFVHLLTEERG